MAGPGSQVCFHGAFNDRAAAERKAEARGGRVLKRRVNGKVRYLVISPLSSSCVRLKG